MKDLLDLYENKEPEIVFNWKDAETEAEGWTVINSLRGGAAGGGGQPTPPNPQDMQAMMEKMQKATEENEAKRDDENFSHVSVWEYTGKTNAPEFHKEPLVFENVQPSQRSYK